MGNRHTASIERIHTIKVVGPSREKMSRRTEMMRAVRK